MRGYVTRKKREDGTPLGTWLYVLDLGICQAQRCESCGKASGPSGGR